MNRHLLNGFSRSEKLVAAFFELPRFVGFDFERLGKIAVVWLDVFTLSSRPDHSIAVGRHDFEDLQFSLHHVEVGLSVDKLQTGTPAENAVAVGGSIDVMPDVVLGEDGVANGFELLLCSGRGSFLPQQLRDQCKIASLDCRIP
jgi:hypothetical protein